MIHRPHRLSSAFAVLALAAGASSPACFQKTERDVPASSAGADHAPEHAVDPKGIRWRKVTLDEALDQAGKEQKLVFVDFWTTWCGWCKELDHKTFTDPAVIAAMNERYVCLSIDAESKDGRPLKERFAVSSYPQLLILHKDGKVKYRINGFLPPETFLARISKDPVPR
jgi:thiol:disulfide interchange protein